MSSYALDLEIVTLPIILDIDKVIVLKMKVTRPLAVCTPGSSVTCVSTMSCCDQYSEIPVTPHKYFT